MILDEADITKIYGFVKSSGPVTTQEITEWMYGCQKGDGIYEKNVEYVGKIMQYLKRHNYVTGERFDTGHGYQVCRWVKE